MAGRGSKEADAERVTANGRDVSQIDPRERDVELDLPSQDWGGRLDETVWTRVDDGPRRRRFYRDVTVEGKDNPGRELRDHMVRFPSAPIYGINRRQIYEMESGRDRPNRHTLRLLTRPDGTRAERPVTRLFVFHNGLNETNNLRFFYQLADWILEEDEVAPAGQRTACLLAPFPGHLMHFPYGGPFVQTPLSRYLEDAGDLFRHFMRYMVEMRWLLSIVNNKAPTGWMVGGTLVGHNPSLAKRLALEWERLWDASFTALADAPSSEATQGDPEGTAPAKERVVGPAIDTEEIGSIAAVLRTLLGRENLKAPAELPLHVVGYSLGGFLAQSVFFAWPNLVSSCSTICSGGAIRALSPTAFADPEEWQSVLHSLRPEIEGSMLAGKIVRDDDGDGDMIGMPADRFGYLHRIFNQVFMQEDHSSYKQRLSEYGSRMLFVSGGEDPIIRPQDVLDASPKEGVTMLSIAQLTHFLGEETRSDREVERKQREFWLPEAGRLIARAAKRADELKEEEFQQARAQRRRPYRRFKDEKSPERPKQAELASPEFERALDWVVDQVTPDSGWLFVCRNSIPSAFLRKEHRDVRGTAMHHHDVVVQDYVAGLGRRAEILEDLDKRVMLCVSGKLEPNFVGDTELFDPHGDAVGRMSTKDDRTDVWNRFVEEWDKHVRWFEGGLLQKPRFTEDPEKIRIAKKFAKRTATWQNVPRDHLTISKLPDVWISINGRVPDVGPSTHSLETTITDLIEWVSAIVAEQQSKRAKERKQSKNDELAEWLQGGELRIVRVSGAELNPRYRGRFEENPSRARLLLAHCAAGLALATAEPPKPKLES